MSIISDDTNSTCSVSYQINRIAYFWIPNNTMQVWISILSDCLNIALIGVIEFSMNCESRIICIHMILSTTKPLMLNEILFVFKVLYFIRYVELMFSILDSAQSKSFWEGILLISSQVISISGWSFIVKSQLSVTTSSSLSDICELKSCIYL